MPGGFNGNGTYVRYYNWTNDANSNINIRADRMDTECDGYATGLSTCITKDGQTTITANIPFNNKRITNLGDGTALTDAATLGQAQNGASTYVGTVAGTANAITFSLTPSITAYAAGQKFQFLPSSNNTAATTIAVNGLTAKTVKKRGTEDLNADDILAGQIAFVEYDGTYFQLLNPAPYTGFFAKQIAYMSRYYN